MTNAAAIGYALMAADAMGLDEDQLRKLEFTMMRLMDRHTEAEAEKVYRNN